MIGSLLGLLWRGKWGCEGLMLRVLSVRLRRVGFFEVFWSFWRF